MAEATMRLDRFLWFARLAKTRTVAQELAATGRLRCDGRLVEKAAAAIRVGNVLTFAAHGRVRTVRVDALPPRRGPAPEARACYTDLTVGTEAPQVANVSQQDPID
ncbi:RNA-binding S4 domain-containing protein [Sphingomonas aerophila]|jgi:ribosome-associated heat shock protein Hsp15|uniref:Ribosome-associated heat shock protein Hsp15 n=1 Tax=Sphingomonas aerophila TaxID=1344948 RepID=A0A7W9BA53_9SPHN|nr:RNA-binding S4 domain-containing protein [Sphingomonas aerophila]MBB5713430.1 ribosome-associated heat shock protein Hsp15 [Sphingomonas aerophila]